MMTPVSDKAFAVMIILYLILEILPIVAISIGVCIIAFFIYKLISYIIASRKKKRIELNRYISFLEELSKHSGIIYSIPSHIEEVKNLANSEFERYVSSCSVDSKLLPCYEKFGKDCLNLYSQSSSWVCPHVNNSYYDLNGSSLRRTEIKSANPNDYISLDLSGMQTFSFLIGEACFILCPIFIIKIDGDKISFIQYTSLSLSKPEQITVQENTYSTIRGASPIYYRYLHERVNGGPDRRYNYNPSTPVYYYYKQQFNLVASNYLITSKQSVANALMNSLRSFQNSLNAHPIGSASRVEDFDVSKDEYASVFKEIISSCGKNVVLKKLFVSMLDDYRVTKHKENLKDILNKITDENLWATIIADDCSFETLNQIKSKLTTTTQFEERDIVETLAYLGYGLQLQRI